MAEATAEVVTFRDVAIDGKDGSRMLVAKEPTDASAARTMIRVPIDERAGDAG